MTYDKNYFKDSKLERKHFFDMLLWENYFNPKNILLVGDGIGHRTYAGTVIGMNVVGCDFPEVVKQVPYKEITDRYFEGDIRSIPCVGNSYDLVAAYDVLEHLENIEDVEKALKELYRVTNKYVLISVPDIDNPNLNADSTHHIKRSRGWWQYKIRQVHFEILETPANFIFKEQLIVGVKNDSNGTC
mgnify:CR=1 FL=1